MKTKTYVYYPMDGTSPTYKEAATMADVKKFKACGWKQVVDPKIYYVNGSTISASSSKIRK